MAGPFIGIAIRETADAGWSSTYYPLGTSYSTCMTSLQTINTAEMALMPSNVVCRVLRVSDMTQKKDVLLEAPTQGKGNYLGAGGPAIPADPNIALACKFLCGNASWFTHYLRGLPPLLMDISDPMSITWAPGDLGAPIAAWFLAVKNNAQLVQKRPGPPPTLTPIPISSYVQPASGSHVPLSIRRAGRPFKLRRGRHLT